MEQSKSILYFPKIRSSRPFSKKVQNLIFFQKNKILGEIWSILFLPISLFWLLGCYLKLLLTKTIIMDIPVVSIGNIEAGGTGKTPLTVEIAKIIKDVEKKISIVCYAADRKNPDESTMISKSVREVAVYYGKNRRSLVDKAVKDKPGVIIVDDGFQYFDIGNKIDLILLDPETPLNLLLPAGRMRLPASFLKYADAIIVRKTPNNKNFYQKFLKKIEKYHKPTFFAEYQMMHLVDQQGNKISVSILKNKKVIAFCGIAKPSKFIEMINKTGIREIHAIWYPDHFVYHQSDIDELKKLFSRIKPDILITTEKDIVKLEKFKIDIPLYGLTVRMKIEPYEEFRTWLMNKIFPGHI